MIITKELICKGTLALCTTAAATTLGVIYKNEISEVLWSGDYPSIIEKVGLKCENGECTLKTNETKINIKHGENTKEKGKSFTTTGDTKLKLYEISGSNDYKQGFKFVVEGGDITLTANGTTESPTITKLEEFETYEITEDGNEYYLSRKSEAIDEKSKALGLPDDCKLPKDNESEKTCAEIDVAKLKALNFEGKSEGEPTINGSNTKATLKIDKVEETDKSIFSEGYRLTFETNEDITIPKLGSSNESISIKKNTNTEFKIKKDKTKLTLEKAWDIKKLAKKVGLTDCNESGTTKTCKLPSSDETLNVYVNDSNNLTKAKTEESDKTITYLEDQEGHNQGFKFTVAENIELTKTGQVSKDIKILKGASYEIKEQTVNETKD